MLRDRNIQGLASTDLDVLVVGGGINGAVSAAALASRGIRVGLIDARDFAGFTSQHSSNLVWGGIKYMESYEFGLVSELCRSRNELMRSFPSTIREIRFLTAITKGFRHHPALLWSGAWLYWLMGRGYTERPRYLSAEDIGRTEPVIDTSDCNGGLEYSDAYLFDNDARFVFSFVRSAISRGCQAANYVEATGFQRDAGGWRVAAKDRIGGRDFDIRCRVLINATGAYVDPLNAAAGIVSRHRHVLSKGIHLIVPRIGESGKVMAFFADDGRLFFAIPMAHRTCIGTTDTRVNQAETEVTNEDREFVLSNINSRLQLPRPLTREDIIAERCGVRPLVVNQEANTSTDFLQLSRKHVVETDSTRQHISIFGGKLTDCINVGEEICDQVMGLGLSLDRPLVQSPDRWYGEPSESERQAFMAHARSVGLDRCSANDTGEPLAERLWRRYGAAAATMVHQCAEDPSQMAPVLEGTGLRRCELEYLRDHEMIVHLDDLLRRRSKLALLYSTGELRDQPGMTSLCKELFGAQAEREYAAYFGASMIQEESAARSA